MPRTTTTTATAAMRRVMYASLCAGVDDSPGMISSRREPRDMRRDDAPALRGAEPRVTLAPRAAGIEFHELGVRRGVVVAVGRDHGVLQRAREIHVRARAAEAGDRVVAVEILEEPEAKRVRALPEELVQCAHVVADERSFVAKERRGHL